MIPLRPIGLGEILNGSIITIRRNPKATLGFTAVVMAISTALSTAVAAGELTSFQGISQRASTGQQVTLATSGVVSLLLGLVMGVIVTGTLTAVVGRAVLGQQVTMSQVWHQARGRIGALLGLTMLMLLIFFGLWAMLIAVPVLSFQASDPAGVALAIVASVAAIPLTIFIWVKSSMAPSAVVLERVGPKAAICRSWRLTKRSFWRVFGIWIVAYLVLIVVALVLEVPFRVIASLVSGTSGVGFGAPLTSLSGGKLIAYLVIVAVGSLVAATVTRPIVAGVAALLYMDLRMRREGLDIALQTAAGRERATSDEFASVWETPEPGSWGSGQGHGSMQAPGQWGRGQWGPGTPAPGQWGPGTPVPGTPVPGTPVPGTPAPGTLGHVAQPEQGGSGRGAPPGQSTPPS